MPPSQTPGGAGPGEPFPAAPEQEGLVFRLSEGRPDAEPYVSQKPTRGDALSEAETKELLARLPAINVSADDQKTFAVRERSLPPPKTGKTVQDAFPPAPTADAPPEVAKGPLEVLRAQPQGDVPLAPMVSISFNQAMVEVTSLDELAKKPVPATISPQPPGAWRWVGAKTVVFEAGERFPMATTFTVTVPAGTKSASGGALAKAYQFSFQTPPVQLESGTPTDGPHPLSPVLFLAFDQKIDPAAMAKHVSITAGKQTVSTHVASAAEIAADELARERAGFVQAGRWLALALDAPLPRASKVSVTLAAGAPSAEGPRLTAKPQTFGFFTYDPLDVNGSECGYDGCRPLEPWTISFNNDLDAKKFKPEQIKVSPAVPGLRIKQYGNQVTLEGRSKGRTKYKVTVAASLTDRFGQTLGQDKTVLFSVGSARPSFYVPGENLQVLDPAGAGKLSVFTVNHKQIRVKVNKVELADWPAFLASLREWQEDRKAGKLPGKPVVDETMNIAGGADELVETRVDLSRGLTGGKGMLVVHIEPTVQGKDRWEQQAARSWIQATDIGLTAFRDSTEMLAWATSLKDGKPLSGVAFSLEPWGSKGTSGEDGTAKLPLGKKEGTRAVLVARRGDDVAFLPEWMGWYEGSSSWLAERVPDRLSWYVADDRGIYKPGEQVRVKGWLRRIAGGKLGDVEGVAGAARQVRWKASDAQGNEIAAGSGNLDVAGGFDFSFTLGKTVNLGQATLSLEAVGGAGEIAGRQGYHSLQVQEFRRPEFEVTAKPSAGPFFVGEHATVTAAAKYYAGGGLPGAPASWSVNAERATFAPPGHDDYTFGQWLPWWEGYGRGRMYIESMAGKNLQGTTDGAGEHTVRLDFDSVAPARTMSVTAQAVVQDVNRQGWAASANLLVHPSAVYVGLKTSRYFVGEGEPLELAAIVTDIDGKQLGGQKIAMRAVRVDHAYVDDEYKTTEVDVSDCSAESNDRTDAVCTFRPKEGGVYKLRAAVFDAKGRRNESEVTMWVAGGTQPPRREVTEEALTLVPDKNEYHAGDVAEILVQAPFAGGEGQLQIHAGGLVSSQRVTFKGSSAVVKVPITAGYTPNVWIEVQAVGAAPRVGADGKASTTLPKRPAFASGRLNLPVPPRERKLGLTLKPDQAELEPGGETVVRVEVKDSAGKPVAGAQVAVVVVDEAVLALTKYAWPDPLEVFYTQRDGGVSAVHQRQWVVLASPDDVGASVVGQGAEGRSMAMDSAATAGGAPPPMAAPAPEAAAPKMARSGNAPGAGAGPPPIAMRTNFDALAVFAPTEKSDGSGTVAVKIKLPDNLTRYRITAVAVSGDKYFGKQEATLVARLPLMVRPSPPRFLNFGDRFELPVVLQNQTDQPLIVKVAARASNATLAESVGRKVTVPARDRIEVRFPAAAGQPGTARFQLAATTGSFADAAEVFLPVWTPSTSEAFATYGEIDQGAIVQTIRTPGDVVPEFGGVQVTTSSTAVASLTDAFLYLVRYPYECAEQLSSRIMGIAGLRDVLTAFAVKDMPSKEVLEASVAADLELLQKLQNHDGGFGFWRRGDESWPWVSIHVAHALERAAGKGYKVPSDLVARAQEYLKNVERHIPAWYPIDTRRGVIAYALYVRERMGIGDRARARRLIQEAGGVDKLPLEVSGWLLFVLSGDTKSTAELEALRKHLNNRVDETAGAAHFTTSYTDGTYLLLHSDRRADAVILEALIKDQPKSDLPAKLVKGLLGHRKQGRWANTNESSFVLLALDNYFDVYEKVTPDFVARVWLGEQYAGEHGFKGRTTEEHLVDVPMKWLAAAKGMQKLVVEKKGAGRLYYRIGMTYTPKDLAQKPRDAGFTVLRSYEGVDDKADVTRDEQGVWHVKAGARVRVKLSLVAPSRRYHVALVDPLPAGFEAMNPVLAVTGSVPESNPGAGPKMSSWWYWSQHWYQHENLRDERVEAFTTLLWEGVYDYEYVARATTPGHFVVPPSKAEEMYTPETFGRSGSDRVVVE